MFRREVLFFALFSLILAAFAGGPSENVGYSYESQPSVLKIILSVGREIIQFIQSIILRVIRGFFNMIVHGQGVGKEPRLTYNQKTHNPDELHELSKETSDLYDEYNESDESSGDSKEVVCTETGCYEDSETGRRTIPGNDPNLSVQLVIPSQNHDTYSQHSHHHTYYGPYDSHNQEGVNIYNRGLPNIESDHPGQKMDPSNLKQDKDRDRNDQNSPSPNSLMNVAAQFGPSDDRDTYSQHSHHFTYYGPYDSHNQEGVNIYNRGYLTRETSRQGDGFDHTNRQTKTDIDRARNDKNKWQEFLDQMRNKQYAKYEQLNNSKQDLNNLKHDKSRPRNPQLPMYTNANVHQFMGIIPNNNKN